MISRERKLELLRAFAVRSISYGNLIDAAFDGKTPDAGALLELVKTAQQSKSQEDLEFALLILYQELLRDHKAGDPKILCELILEDWHYSHEDIATILSKIKDPDSVECLYRASGLHLDYLDYDETFQLARKCIKGLAAIGTPEANARLFMLTTGTPEPVSQYAKKELKRLR